MIGVFELTVEKKSNEPNQGPLKIWTEHSNFPLQGRGDSKTPIALLRPNIF
jgi:hypothetical protein